MNWMRVSIVIIVVYVLGLGTGMVLGVVLSFREFSEVAAAPPPPATSPAAPVPAPSASSPAPVAPVPAPSASPLASPSAVPVAPSPSPSDLSLPPLTASPSPSPSAAAPAPSASPMATGSPAGATLVIRVRQGDGFKILLDGVPAGAAPATLRVSADRPHQVKVLGGGRFASWESRFSIPAGKVRRIEATLTRIAAPAPAYRPPPPPAPRATFSRPQIEGHQRF